MARNQIQPFGVYIHTKKKSLLLVTVCGFLVAGCSTPHHVTKWEYRESHTLAEVNQLAEQGWIVVNLAVPYGGPYVYLLRRAKP